MSKIVLVATQNDNARIDAFIANNTDISRSRVAALIKDGYVSVNGKNAVKSYKVTANDEICVFVPEPVELDVKAEDIPLDIVYEDEHLLVVNKPKGMVVHPAAGNYSGTLVNALLYHCKGSLSGINGVMRPGIVHRIDKDTSGLLIVAKSDFAHQGLAEQIKEHSFTREYEAVVYGNIKADNGSIDAPIGRHPIKRKQMAVTKENSKQAITHYEVINRYGEFTHIKLRLETGRTHQIRVHMSYIGHAVAGDGVYGPKNVISDLGGQCLHAKKIGFIHPVTQQYLEFESENPEYFNLFLEKINKNNLSGRK